MKKKKLISEIGEFKLIEKIKKQIADFYKVKFPSSSIVVGIGDDAAAVRNEPGKLLVATTDMLVEGVHFKLNTTTPYNIGWKAMAVNLSDIAAMGAFPMYVLVTLGLPVNTSIESVNNLVQGALDLANRFKVFLIGGDIVRSPKALVVNMTLWGAVAKKQILKRSGAKVGDKIMVTGTLGDSAAGLKILQSKKKIKNTLWAKNLINQHLKPYPRIKEARLLASKELAHSMIDCSDGAALSIKFICQASKVGANIWLDKIPASLSLQQFSLVSDYVASSLGLYGGEDYELVFTVPSSKEAKVIKIISEELGTKVTTIGEIVSSKNGIGLFDKQRKINNLVLKGYEHFKH